MPEAAWYIWAMVLVAVIGLAVSVGAVIYRGGMASRVEPRAARNAGATAFLSVAGWIAVSAWLADSGYYSGDAGGLIPLVPIVFAAFLTSLLLATRFGVVSEALASPGSLVRLSLPHTVRVMGGVFLIVMAQASLPAVFALPAGLGDIAIGLAAPFVAWRLAHGKAVRHAVWFNILGLFDLVVAITIGFFAAAGPFQVLDVQPTTQALTMLPLAMVPTVAVPIAITMHVVSLRRLRIASNEASGNQSRLRGELV